VRPLVNPYSSFEQGWDHAVPEVMVNWYMVRVRHHLYNPSIPSPRVTKYYEYLATRYSNIASSIKGFIEYGTGEDLSVEHGFLREMRTSNKTTNN
jgi:hypothetical protein